MLHGIADIGSNTVRLNVYRCTREDIGVIFSKKESIGLAFYIKEGRLTHEGVEKLLTVLRDMKNDLDYLKIKSYRFFSTASLRNIDNGAQVIQVIKDKLNLEIDLLSGAEEGELSFYGSIPSIIKDDGLLIDLGGGSVEIVIFKNRKIIEKHSIPVGSLKMYKKYVSGMIPNKKEREKIKDKTFYELEKTGLHRQKIPFMCGVGGSVRTIVKILTNLHLHENKTDIIGVEKLKKLKNELNHDNHETYNKILYVKPSRIHTIVPALVILEAITSFFGCRQLQVSEFSVREGYLYKKILNRC